jgi:hypothetical protein
LRSQVFQDHPSFFCCQLRRALVFDHPIGELIPALARQPRCRVTGRIAWQALQVLQV